MSGERFVARRTRRFRTDSSAQPGNLRAASRRLWYRALCTLLAGCTSFAVHAGTIRALVLGVDTYDHLPTLQGAVNDATDIKNALDAQGADVKMLLNRDVTFSAIRREWKDLIGRAQPGDVIFLHYAGHSTQLGQAIPGDEKDDQLDEVSVFADFHLDKKHQGHQREAVILDNEWRAMIGEAAPHPTIVIMDTCNSGTLTRRAICPNPEDCATTTDTMLNVRTPFPDTMADPLLRPAVVSIDQLDAAAKVPEVEAWPHEIYLGAVKDGSGAAEYVDVMRGNARGALSLAVANALRGFAGSGPSTSLTLAQLFAYVSRSVNSTSDGAQIPVLRAGNRFQPGSPLVKLRDSAAEDARPLPPLTLRLAPGVQGLTPGELTGVREVVGAEPALLELTERHELRNRAGELLADFSASTFFAEDVQGAVNKWRTKLELDKLMARQPLDVGVEGGQHTFMEGVNVRFEVRGTRGGHRLLMFNLASNGVLQNVHPPAATPEKFAVLEERGTFTHAAPVIAPFGADHLVVVEAPEGAAFGALQQWVLKNRQSVLDGTSTLLTHLQAVPGARIGVVPLYTVAHATK